LSYALAGRGSVLGNREVPINGSTQDNSHRGGIPSQRHGAYGVRREADDRKLAQRRLDPDGDGGQRSVGSGDDGLCQYQAEPLDGRAGPQRPDYGRGQVDNAEFVVRFEQLARRPDYLGRGFEPQSDPDSQNLFTLGHAAIFPAGSWEINGFRSLADFEIGSFLPPIQTAGDTCYISDHIDMGLGLKQAGRLKAQVAESVNHAAEILDLSAYLTRRRGDLSGGSASVLPLVAPSCANPSCSCSINRSRTSTRPCARKPVLKSTICTGN